jgi:hypothetical protein
MNLFDRASWWLRPFAGYYIRAFGASDAHAPRAGLELRLWVSSPWFLSASGTADCLWDFMEHRWTQGVQGWVSIGYKL